jgi:hypothetical protein
VPAAVRVVLARSNAEGLAEHLREPGGHGFNVADSERNVVEAVDVDRVHPANVRRRDQRFHDMNLHILIPTGYK